MSSGTQGVGRILEAEGIEAGGCGSSKGFSTASGQDPGQEGLQWKGWGAEVKEQSPCDFHRQEESPTGFE